MTMMSNDELLRGILYGCFRSAYTGDTDYEPVIVKLKEQVVFKYMRDDAAPNGYVIQDFCIHGKENLWSFIKDWKLFYAKNVKESKFKPYGERVSLLYALRKHIRMTLKNMNLENND